MPALNFDARRRVIRRGQQRYMLLGTPSGGQAVVPATCRHRGGPLDLGELTFDSAGQPLHLRCPWHQRCQSLRQLLQNPLPATIRDGAGTVIIPEQE